MADGEQTDDKGIRPEAFDRVKQERDEARQQAQQATQALAAVAVVDKAYEHFKGVDGIGDPYAAAKLASQSITDVTAEDLTERLDGWLEAQRSVFSPPTPPSSSDGDKPPSTPPPPGSGRPQPSPGGTGGQPAAEPLTIMSPEVQAARRRGDRQQIKQWVDEGRLKLSPGNPMARG